MSSSICLAAVAEAGRLDGEDVDRAAQLVHDEGGEGFAVDVVGDDDDVLRHLEDLLEDRQDVGDGGDALVGDEDVGLFEDGLHALRVGHEVGGGVAAVELHAIDELGLHADAAGLLDGDDAVLADLLHDLGDHVADLGVVGGDGGDLGDLVLAGYRLGHAAEVLDGSLDALLDALLEAHRVGAGSDVLQALADDGCAEDGGGGGAVTGDVVGLGGDFLGELGAHVLEGVGELDLLGDGDAVVDDGGRAVLLVEDDVAAAGAEGDA